MVATLALVEEAASKAVLRGYKVGGERGRGVLRGHR